MIVFQFSFGLLERLFSGIYFRFAGVMLVTQFSHVFFALPEGLCCCIRLCYRSTVLGSGSSHSFTSALQQAGFPLGKTVFDAVFKLGLVGLNHLFHLALRLLFCALSEVNIPPDQIMRLRLTKWFGNVRVSQVRQIFNLAIVGVGKTCFREHLVNTIYLNSRQLTVLDNNRTVFCLVSRDRRIWTVVTYFVVSGVLSIGFFLRLWRELSINKITAVRSSIWGNGISAGLILSRV